VISPIGKVLRQRRLHHQWRQCRSRRNGPANMVDIQYGRAADPHNWIRKVF
jgi:hypothetical protein